MKTLAVGICLLLAAACSSGKPAVQWPPSQTLPDSTVGGPVPADGTVTPEQFGVMGGLGFIDPYEHGLGGE